MNKKSMKICLLGASFDTGNMGVNALSASSVKCIIHQWPDARIILLGMDREPGSHSLLLDGKKIELKKIPIRFSKNIFLPYHFFVLFNYALLLKIFGFRKIKEYFSRKNEYLKELLETDIAMDITGGDSFSDIYGMRRFILDFLRKWLMLFLGKAYVLLPQTYGPYNGRIAKMLARFILKKSEIVYSRDHEGIDLVKRMLKSSKHFNKIRFMPDVAFVLHSYAPENFDCDSLLKRKLNNTVKVGFNISGLLYHGGYTRDDMFNLKENYSALIVDIVKMLLSRDNIRLFLIPHVYPSSDMEVESDPLASEKIYKMFQLEYKDRIYLINKKYDQSELKFIIGNCDIMIGSRMHACIAALSQCIPAVGLAYSKKFKGVFGSVGVENNVVQLNTCSKSEVFSSIESAIDNIQKTGKILKKNIPEVQSRIMNMCGEIPVK